jgi:deoxyribonuclease V
MASHLGLVLDVQTIGVAKSLMLGKNEDGKILVGNEIRAAEVKTKEHAKPLYVSPGHRISLETSVELVKQCIRLPHKLPEPLHLAHRLAEKLREESSKS